MGSECQRTQTPVVVMKKVGIIIKDARWTGEHPLPTSGKDHLVERATRGLIQEHLICV